jgi:HEAT repeat protein
MTIEISSSKPGSDAQPASSATAVKKAVGCTSAHGDNHHAPEKNAAVLTAAHHKVDSVESLVDELASPDPVRRAAAVEALGRTANAAAAPALITALRDADADVAREAATSLGSVGSAVAVEPLLAVLNNRDGYFHCVVRAAASHSLGQLRDLRAVAPLLDAINDPITEVSAEAIRALASLADPRGIPALLQVVRNQHGYFLDVTRHAAILGLAKIGGEQAACELRFVASNQWENAVIRAAAIAAAPHCCGSAVNG